MSSDRVVDGLSREMENQRLRFVQGVGGLADLTLQGCWKQCGQEFQFSRLENPARETFDHGCSILRTSGQGGEEEKIGHPGGQASPNQQLCHANCWSTQPCCLSAGCPPFLPGVSTATGSTYLSCHPLLSLPRNSSTA